MRDVPFSAIQFPLYETLKLIEIRYLADGKSEKDVVIPSVLNSVNGAIAGSFSGLVTTPLDVVKTRLMTFQQHSHGGSVLAELRNLVQQEGAKGMFRGASIRMLYLSVGGSAFFGIYEHCRKTIQHIID